MSEQIYSHSTPLKIRLDFSGSNLNLHSTHEVFELLKGRELTFPHGNESAVEFEMLYVGELAIFLTGVDNAKSDLADMYMEFSWTNGRELLNIKFEYI